MRKSRITFPISSFLFLGFLIASSFGYATSESRQPNRLHLEKSPYLLQHANNPVDWYPWGDEAFERAKKEDKPVFLSIGYSTCHWCHVMERESFENHETAAQLNTDFISIKVDREERPDIDQIYMDVVQKMTGSGGWPLTVFLTPERVPFFGGTYFPPEDRHKRPGFPSVLSSIRQQWKENRERLVETGNKVVIRLQKDLNKNNLQSASLDNSILDNAYSSFASMYDARYGGFGRAPKFPRPHTFLFLMRYWKRTGDADALDMVLHTLSSMAKGGIYDHLRGGFHRYSTDRTWHVPHFEKMIYDQALIVRAYLEAYQITGKQQFADVSREVFDYAINHMQSKRGGFFSAEDADSAPDPKKPNDKREGAYYVWTKDQISKALDRESAEIFSYYFGVKPNGNVERDPHEEFTGKNILSVAKTLGETQKPFGKTSQEIEESIARSKQILLNRRTKRAHPHLDDKVLTDWSSLMISSLAFGYIILGDAEYLKAAEKSMAFILNEMRDKNGRLLHRYRDGESAIPGFLNDYAFLLLALEDLYEATFDPQYLTEAIKIGDQMIELFWDEARNGGFFFSAHDSERILVQSKKIYDGAIPSGNSMAILGLLKLEKITASLKYEEYAFNSLSFFSQQVASRPSRYPQLLIGLDFYLGPSREVVIAGNRNDRGTQDMLNVLYSHFLPNKVVLLHPTKGSHKEKIEALAPFIKNQLQIDGKSTAYICKDHICKLPTSDINRFTELIQEGT